MKLYIHALKHYINFRGCSCRKEIIWFALFNSLFAGAALGLDNLCGWTFGRLPFGPAYIAYCIFTLCPSLSLQVRRLHDTERSGWVLLIALVPIVGPFCLFAYLFFARGDLEENRYGAPPVPRHWYSPGIIMRVNTALGPPFQGLWLMLSRTRGVAPG